MDITVKKMECGSCGKDFYENEDEELDTCPQCGALIDSVLEMETHVASITINPKTGAIEIS